MIKTQNTLKISLEHLLAILHIIKQQTTNVMVDGNMAAIKIVNSYEDLIVALHNAGRMYIEFKLDVHDSDEAQDQYNSIKMRKFEEKLSAEAALMKRIEASIVLTVEYKGNSNAYVISNYYTGKVVEVIMY